MAFQELASQGIQGVVCHFEKVLVQSPSAKVREVTLDTVGSSRDGNLAGQRSKRTQKLLSIVLTDFILAEAYVFFAKPSFITWKEEGSWGGARGHIQLAVRTVDLQMG